MKKEVIKGSLPRIVPRFGVIPTRVEKNKKKYTRKQKHNGSPEMGPFFYSLVWNNWFISLLL